MSCLMILCLPSLMQVEVSKLRIYQFYRLQIGRSLFVLNWVESHLLVLWLLNQLIHLKLMRLFE